MSCHGHPHHHHRLRESLESTTEEGSPVEEGSRKWD